MRTYIPKIESVLITWTHEKILSALPLPGRPGFTVMRDELTPLGLNPLQMIMERTHRLGDAMIKLDLLNGRVGVGFTYIDFRIGINNLSAEDLEPIKQIANGLFSVTHAVEPEFTTGKCTIKYSIHFNLPDNDNQAFLSEYLAQSKSPKWSPRAFVYAFNPDEPTDSVGVVVTKSLAIPDGLYIELTSERLIAPNVEIIQERFMQDYTEAHAALGFELPIA